MMNGKTDRLGGIDAIRGVAIFGIVAENIVYAGLPENFYSSWSVADSWAWTVVNVLLAGAAFRYMFYILLGLGIGFVYLDKERFDYGQYFKRVVALLVLGVVNAYVLLWEQDILVTFAIVSALIVPLLQLPLVIVAASLTALATAFYLFYDNVLIGPKLARFQRGDESDIKHFSELVENQSVGVEAKIEGFSHGYTNGVKYVAGSFGSDLQSLVGLEIWEASILVLLGVVVYKGKVFLWDQGKMLAAGMICLVVGLCSVSWLVLGYGTAEYSVPVYGYRVFRWDYFLSHLLLGCGYSFLIVHVARRGGALSKVTGIMEVLGRYSLTTYLFQSILYMVLFVILKQFAQLSVLSLYGWGLVVWAVTGSFGWWCYRRGMMGPAEYVTKRFYRKVAGE